MKDILTPDISAIAVFLQGLFSFFSPCVLPLLPVYFGYLSGGTAERNADGSLHFERGRVMINTLQHSFCWVWVLPQLAAR